MNGLLLLALLGAGYYILIAKKPRPAMTRARAARLLEVDEDAGADEIRAAHRRIVRRVHPDAGGTAELTAEVNLARDTLLARRLS